MNLSRNLSATRIVLNCRAFIVKSRWTPVPPAAWYCDRVTYHALFNSVRYISRVFNIKFNLIWYQTVEIYKCVLVMNGVWYNDVRGFLVEKLLAIVQYMDLW